MQIQENRTTTGAPVDPFSATRETQLGFAPPTTNSEFNLFAEIFNSFAASAPPPSPTNVEPSQSSDLAPAPETTRAKDEEDISDDPSDRTGLTPYALPVPSQPILTKKVDAAAKSDLKAKSINNADSQSRSVSVDPPLDGNAGKEPIATLTEKPTDESTSNVANIVQVPIEQSQKSVVAPENQVSRSKQTKTTSETSDSASPVSQNNQQPTSPVSEASPDQPMQLNNDVATSDATHAASGVSDGSQSSDRDRGDRRRRSNDVNNRASGVDRQEPNREIPKDSAIAPASSANSRPDAQSSAVSNGFVSAESIGNASPSTASQVGPAASYLAALQAIAIQRESSGSVMRGSVVQGVQSASGATSAKTFTRGTERSAESAGADSTPSSRRTDIADRARLVHRIAKAFQKMGIDSGQVRLKMHPDELGGVQIEMQVTGRSVKAMVIADGEDARQLLQDSLPELRQRLESQGLTVERLDVELRSESERSSLMNQNQQQQNQRSNDEAASRNVVWRRPAEARDANSIVDTKPEPRPDARTARANRSLDLKI